MSSTKLFAAAISVVAINASVLAQSVTVTPAGGGGDHSSLSAAIAAVQANPAGPDVITFTSAGPYTEAAQVLISGDASTNDLTIKASPGIRPLVISNFNGDGAITLAKSGNTTVSDIILIPAQGTAATRPQAAVLLGYPATASDTGFVYYLSNLLITSNNGADQPAGSLDGLTSPTISVPANFATFKDEGVQMASSTNPQIHRVYCTDVIVTGLNGSDGADGFRTQGDGIAGSDYTVGPGCVVSYCHSNSVGNAAFQPGGNDLSTTIVKVQGTAAKPVKFINNTLNGINISGSSNSAKSFSHLIIANNTRYGLAPNATTEQLSFTNCTFVNNGIGPIDAGNFTKSWTASNCIFAGNGTETTSNTINVSTSGAGTFTISDSAIVLSGPHKLATTLFDGDGLDDNTPTSNVTKTNVTSADPQFASLSPSSPDFAKVMNPTYANAGPGGTRLTGGGTYGGPPPAAVSDWTWY